MPEPVVTPPVTPAPPGDPGKGTDPTKTVAPTSPALDLTKVGDDDFAKVFDDPRLFKHPRFKSLNDRAHKAEEYEKQEEARKLEEAKKKGEWEKIAQTNEQRAKTAEEKYKTSVLDNRILTEAVKQGAVDTEAVLKLVDRSKIILNDDGTVLGIDEAVKSLLEAKAYLKSGNTTIIGAPTNPGNPTNSTVKRFKLSQVNDPAFYQANQKDIDAAFKAGTVENDLDNRA